MTWSLEGLIDDARRGVAWAAQEVLERLWPPRSRYPLDGAQQLTDKEAEEEAAEPASVCDECGKRLGDVCCTSGEVGGKFCSARCSMAAEDRANPYGPADDSEDDLPIIAPTYAQLDRMDHQTALLEDIRNLVQQLTPQGLKADRLDAEMWRATIGAEDQSVFRSGGQMKQYGPRPKIATAFGPYRFKNSAAATGPSAADRPVGDTPRSPTGHLDSSLVHGVPSGGGEAVCSFPPEPASPHPNPTLGKVHRYWTGDLAAWLEPAVMTAIDEHRPDYYERDGIYCCGVRCPDWGDWYQHVAPLLAAHVAQALPDYPHHHCEFPDAAPGQRWRCYCGRAWRAVEDGPLDIAWEPHPLNQPT